MLFSEIVALINPCFSSPGVNTEKATLSTRALSQVADSYDDISATLTSIQTNLANLDESEKGFVTQEQEIERMKYEEMERAFRTRSDEAPKQMQAVQEKTRVRASSKARSCSFSVFVFSFVNYLN